MDTQTLRDLLTTLQRGEADVDQVMHRLRELPFEDIGLARIDHHRHLRIGMPEVVYGHAKTPDQIVPIVASMIRHGSNTFVTRLDPDKAREVLAALDHLEASGVPLPPREHDPLGRTLTLRLHPWHDRGRGLVAVVCAGTSDLAVAHEALNTLRILDQRADLIVDVGVAGLHRLLAVRERLEQAAVIIAVAGMEGALPGVLSGLVSPPVIAVPTSTGYGAAFGGLSALLTMLNSCSAGLTVVNIDNGFGAACAAAKINRADQTHGDAP